MVDSNSLMAVAVVAVNDTNNTIGCTAQSSSKLNAKTHGTTTIKTVRKKVLSQGREVDRSSNFLKHWTMVSQIVSHLSETFCGLLKVPIKV